MLANTGGNNCYFTDAHFYYLVLYKLVSYLLASGEELYSIIEYRKY